MRSDHLLTLAATTLLVAIVACTSSSSSGPGDPPPGDDADAGSDAPAGITGDPDAAGAASDALCEAVARCSPAGLRGNFGDLATCKARQTGVRTDQSFNGASYTRVEADTCVAKLAALSCDAFDPTQLPIECRPHGTLPNGTRCASSAQCASGSCFVASPDSSHCGVCQDRVAEGGDCSAGDCAWNLACVGSTCTRKSLVGEACNSLGRPCLVTLDCVQGKCTARLPANAPCGDPGSPLCNTNAGLVCKPSTSTSPVGTCVPLTFSDVGGKCGVDQAAATVTFCTKSDCSVTSGLGTCTTFVKDGASCVAGSAVRCQPPALCEVEKCVLVRDASLCQ